MGSVLREERLRQQLTLEKLSADTKLTLRSLNAIECDDLSAFASAFFYKSFVKQYASRLQIEIKDIASLMEALAGEIPTPTLPGERDRIPPDVPAIDPPTNRSQTRWAVPAAALVAVLVGCSGVYAWWQGQHNPKPAGTHAATSVDGITAAPDAPVTSPEEQAPAPVPSESSPAENGGASATPAASENSASTETRKDLSPAEVELKLSALENVWISVTTDGKSIFSGVLEASETKIVESRETARLRVGNAGGLTVTYNGRAIGALGPRGQVLTAVFTPENYEILNHPMAELQGQLHIELAKYPAAE